VQKIHDYLKSNKLLTLWFNSIDNDPMSAIKTVAIVVLKNKSTLPLEYRMLKNLLQKIAKFQYAFIQSGLSSSGIKFSQSSYESSVILIFES
jgi:hypothetical protein